MLNKKIFAAFILFMGGGFAVIGAEKKTYYSNDFEKNDDIKFRAAAYPWDISLSKLEKEGRVKVHRMGIAERPDGKGGKAYMVDVTLDKCTSNWGARAMWTTKTPIEPIKLDKPVYLTGFILPEKLPADVTLNFGIIYDGIIRNTGKPVKGCSNFKNIGVNAAGWLVFQQNVSELLKKG